MSMFTLPDHVAGQLAVQTEGVDLCDSTGNKVGRFVPNLMAEVIRQSYARVSKEELERRRQGKDTALTTAEVLEKLRAL